MGWVQRTAPLVLAELIHALWSAARLAWGLLIKKSQTGQLVSNPCGLPSSKTASLGLEATQGPREGKQSEKGLGLELAHHYFSHHLNSQVTRPT